MAAGALSCLEVTAPPRSPLDTTTGIEFDFVNGQLAEYQWGGAPTTLYLIPDRDMHLNQLRFAVQVKGYPAPDVVNWLTKETEFAGLDWGQMEEVYNEVNIERNNITYARDVGLQSAKWMKQDHQFTVSFLDEKQQVARGRVNGREGEELKFNVSRSDYVMGRFTAIHNTTALNIQNLDDLGVGVANYKTITVASGGSFGGPRNDLYIIKVTTAGKMDGTAQVTVTSLRGDNNKGPVTVESGVPIPLGSAGHGATFTINEDNAIPTEALVANNRWVVRVNARAKQGVAGQPPKGEVMQAEPAIKGERTATAEIRFTTALKQVPIINLPQTVKFVRLTWSAKPEASYTGPVEMVSHCTEQPGVPCPQGTAVYDYGLKALLTVATPANGSYFVPGVDKKIKVSFNIYDQNNKTLLLENTVKDPDTGKIVPLSLQTYDDYLNNPCKGQSPGMLFYRAGGPPAGHGFFNEARSNMTALYIAGPRDTIRQNYTVQPAETHLMATVQYPTPTDASAGAAPKSTIWQRPLVPEAEFTLPADAKPGTYVAYLKVQRAFLGQRIYRVFETEFQVGQENRTEFKQTTGNCMVCHSQDATLTKLRHYSHKCEPDGQNIICSPNNDDFSCIVCHNRPRATAAQLVHSIHFHSPDWKQRRNDCSLCHITPGANARPTRGICKACHEVIHPERHEAGDEFDECGTACHKDEPAGHTPLPPI